MDVKLTLWRDSRSLGNGGASSILLAVGSAPFCAPRLRRVPWWPTCTVASPMGGSRREAGTQPAGRWSPRGPVGDTSARSYTRR